MGAAFKQGQSYTVYVLRDPRSYEIRYVGCCSDMNRRYREHVGVAGIGWRPTPREAWILELRTLGVKPLLQILKTGKVQSSWTPIRIEHSVIEHCRIAGCNLTNRYDRWRIKRLYRPLCQSVLDRLVKHPKAK